MYETNVIISKTYLYWQSTPTQFWYNSIVFQPSATVLSSLDISLLVFGIVLWNPCWSKHFCLILICIFLCWTNEYFFTIKCLDWSAKCLPPKALLPVLPLCWGRIIVVLCLPRLRGVLCYLLSGLVPLEEVLLRFPSIKKSGNRCAGQRIRSQRTTTASCQVSI